MDREGDIMTQYNPLLDQYVFGPDGEDTLLAFLSSCGPETLLEVVHVGRVDAIPIVLLNTRLLTDAKYATRVRDALHLNQIEDPRICSGRSRRKSSSDVLYAWSYTSKMALATVPSLSAKCN